MRLVLLTLSIEAVRRSALIALLCGFEVCNGLQS
jgi:hypothetical protein